MTVRLCGEPLVYLAYPIRDGKHAGKQYIAFAARAVRVSGQPQAKEETKSAGWMRLPAVLALGEELSPDTRTMLAALEL